LFNLTLILLNKEQAETRLFKELNQQAKQPHMKEKKLTQNHDYLHQHLFHHLVQVCIIFKLSMEVF
jgi:hypothetical protein